MKFEDSFLVKFFLTGVVLVMVESGKNHDDDDDDDGQPNYCPKDNGMFPNKNDCTSFYNCVEGEAILQTCAPGLLFDPKKKMCNFPNQVRCINECQGANGLFPSQHRCDEFVLCTNGKPERKRCKKGLYFDANLQVCNYKSQVLCNLPKVKKDKHEGTTAKPKSKKSYDDDDDDEEEDDGSYKPRSKKVRVGQYVSGANLFTVHGEALKKGHLELAAASVRSVCPKSRGLFAHADDCTMFYQCYDGEVLMKTCPAGLLFDEYRHMCAQGRDVDCGARSVYNPHSNGPHSNGPHPDGPHPNDPHL